MRTSPSNKESKRTHSPLLRSWFFSYASVLLMPIILCSFYYFHSYNVLKERTLTNQHLVLQNFGEQMDATFYNVINLGNHLKINKYVTAISSQTSTVDSVPALDRHYLRDELKTLQVSNSLFDHISIFFPYAGYIVSCTSSYRQELLPYLENRAVTLSADDWNHICNDLMSASVAGFSSEHSDILCIAQVLQTDIAKNPTAILCVQIDKSELLGHLQNNVLNQHPCTFALINSDSILLATADETELLRSLPLAIVSEYYNRDTASTLLDTSRTSMDTSLMIDCFHTKIPGVKLLSITEKNVFRADLTHLLEIMFITLAICLLTGLITITMYSRRNYRPVKQIVHYINGLTDNSEPESNEYQLIMKMLTRSQSEIEYQHTLLKNSYLQKILTGEIAVQQITDSVASRLQLNLPGSKVCMVLLATQDSGNLFAGDYCDNAASDSVQLLYFIIENVFSELLTPHFPDKYFIIRRQHTAVLISIPEEITQPLPLIEDLTQRLCEFLENSYRLVLHAGISSIQTRQHIADAFLQCETALEYCNLFKHGHLTLYDTIPQNPKINTIPLYTTEYVINLVTTGNLPDITDYFRNIDNELKNRNLSWADAKSCFYFFYQTTAQLRLHCQTQYGLIPEALDFIDNSFFAQSLPEALSQTCIAFTHASAAIQDTQTHLSANRWGTDICLFIKNNYFDTNINLNSIAEHFHVSSAYLSKKFKEQYQKSVIDYLYEIRIIHAKKLISETSLKVTEIAQITGFADSNAFIRIFKKHTGTTPGRYISTFR